MANLCLSIQPASYSQTPYPVKDVCYRLYFSKPPPVVVVLIQQQSLFPHNIIVSCILLYLIPTPHCQATSATPSLHLTLSHPLDKSSPFILQLSLLEVLITLLRSRKFHFVFLKQNFPDFLVFLGGFVLQLQN